LAEALEAKSLGPPYTALSLRRYIPGPESSEVADELHRLGESGMEAIHLAYVLRLLANEHEATQRAGGRVELVWSGPEIAGAGSRDTGVVVRELFTEARAYVLVAGFVISQGRHVFRVLADRMDNNPDLLVRMFLNVSRPYHDETSEAQLLKHFADAFRQHDWPGRRLPAIFYDPRSLALGAGPKASLHAKCIVVDDECALVTSANFTEAAQERNIEAGVLIGDPIFARALRGQFETLVSRGMLKSVPGLG
jgi:phosphatidylserine/phosphatidylglycerophosphate/cardiolipin synthase-like enzyme